MNILLRQGLMLYINFADSGMKSDKKRPLIIIETDERMQELTALSLSSISGKEAESQRDCNYILTAHNPPFFMPSFVKLDSVYRLKYFHELCQFKIDKGQQLERHQFERLLSEFRIFKEAHPNEMKEKECSEAELRRLNLI